VESDFSELEAFCNRWKSTFEGDGFTNFIKQFLLDMANKVVGIIKSNPNHPVDTGAMRAMWGIGSQKMSITVSGTGMIEVDPESAQVTDINVVGENLEVVIWNGMDYSSFIEYGARNRDGTWREGFFVMTFAIDDVQQQIPIRWEAAFSEFILSHGLA